MPSELKPPILLFGNTRSGTTIVQKVMSTHPDIVGWYEPNALWLFADPGRIHDEFDESDATDRVKKYIRKRFLKYQEQHGGRIVLEKTPQNILRIPYVRAIFPEATFLFIVRNPFSFISSVEHKWQRPVTGRCHLCSTELINEKGFLTMKRKVASGKMARTYGILRIFWGVFSRTTQFPCSFWYLRNRCRMYCLTLFVASLSSNSSWILPGSA